MVIMSMLDHMPYVTLLDRKGGLCKTKNQILAFSMVGVGLGVSE